jgi:hypothetical protein
MRDERSRAGETCRTDQPVFAGGDAEVVAAGDPHAHTHVSVGSQAISARVELPLGASLFVLPR